MALTAAQDRGFEINEKELKRHGRFIVRFLDLNREKYLIGKGQGGQVDTAGYALLALKAAEVKPSDTTAAVAEYLLQRNSDTDHWVTNSKRPPSEASQFTTTYVGLRGLQSFGTPDQQERIEHRTATVRDWLTKTVAIDHEDRVFRLRGLKTAGAAAGDIESAVGDLVSTQREDGAWAQLDDMDTDAYATATALVALHEAGGMATADPVYQRGLRHLLNTQVEDGSWHVVTRSRPFQTYFETGFPHGADQFISCAASGWATMALLLACEP
ncbi:MAG: hypothetical protein HYZ74_07415, partial [Elusimicrobia bacterium]|nr:hypothetical protein [Elusimicrobiota bacterium]